MHEIRKSSNNIESTRIVCLSQFNMKQKEKEFIEIENWLWNTNLGGKSRI